MHTINSKTFVSVYSSDKTDLPASREGKSASALNAQNNTAEQILHF